jgi:phosphoglycerate kinase
MAIKYLKTAKIQNKTVLLRVDLNEPLEKGRLADDFRLRAIVPTIKFLQDQHCALILASHLGRPEGKWDKHLSLRLAAERLSDLLQLKFVETDHALPKYRANHLIFYTGDINEPSKRLQLKELTRNNIVLLENLRFYKGEEDNSAFFAKQLADLAEIYVNEAFAVSHHKAASIGAITQYLPSYAGLLLQKEILNLDYILKQPKKPFIVMMGGIKISDKEKTLSNLAKRADKILLGGGLANILLEAEGIDIGQSVVEGESRQLAKQLLRNFKDKLVLPKDAVVANKAMAMNSIRAIPIYDIRKNEVMLDIGPKTILEYARILKTAKTLVWNGPLGHFEVKPFDTGTMALARIVGGVSTGRAFSVVGGGETVEAMRKAHQHTYIDHLSTGGGAMLEYLAGNKLPGLEALK